MLKLNTALPKERDLKVTMSAWFWVLLPRRASRPSRYDSTTSRLSLYDILVPARRPYKPSFPQSSRYSSRLDACGSQAFFVRPLWVAVTVSPSNAPPRGPGLWSMPPAIISHPAFKTLMTAQIRTFLHANPVTTTLSRAARWDQLKVHIQDVARGYLAVVPCQLPTALRTVAQTAQPTATQVCGISSASQPQR